jgi:F-type H+-transporting ATPase subunit gamma
MTERLAEISARIRGVRQLETVISAMRSIAAGRAQQSRLLMAGVDAHAAVVVQAIAEALHLLGDGLPPARPAGRGGLVVFCAEQGFAGGYTARLLDEVARVGAGAALFLVGSRGAALAGQRRLVPAWQTPMAAHADGVPAVAGRVAGALFERLPHDGLERLDMLYAAWTPGRGLEICRRSLLPLDRAAFAAVRDGVAPLTTLPLPVLLARLAEEYVHAELCRAAMHAFAAENEARVQTLAAARSNIGTMLEKLQARERRVRQDTITAEVVELGAATESLRGGKRKEGQGSALDPIT